MPLTRISFAHDKLAKSPQGQSLVEFVMVMPMILLLLLGAFAVGQGMYQGASASLAVKAAMNQKSTLANTPGRGDVIASDIIRKAVHGNLDNGSTVDVVIPKHTDTLTTVLVATRRFTPPVPFLPPVDFTVTQGIPTRIISGNSPDTKQDIITVLGYPAAPAVPPTVLSNVPANTLVPCASADANYTNSLKQNYGSGANPCPVNVSAFRIDPVNNIKY